MNNDIILAGVGGQGILSIAAAIGLAAVNSNLHIKQSEVHGMSQRGGDVQSHLRISDAPIASDLIPAGKAHLIISVEPMEGLRYMPFLSKNGWLVTNITPFDNIPDYPKVDEILKRVKAVKNHIALDADSIAKECGSTKASNIVMLGAASPFIDIPAAGIEEGIRQLFNRKGEDIVNLNLKAFRAGREYSEKNR
ncbi:MAG: indolepyruvate oxidoreductase subunit beta [Bacteroidales bacterium]|jgi:indolepyruvate ferredoxin oxidoreductase beta subunit|nr:indolepyruvate oxidoreductase subunit beta [Bacteroidales bacterium]HNT41830.1 indolepyruvate oxidoreductase subunit beta [Tenuifilaceae bacterium]MBP8643447.1 indolepyruvate oxidoreductase subunit beta [Bacteroidales bacterium]HOA09749.1 indolepyruvate oxidoreductase subunit beta [Tenuifilaceae bacterium]HOC36608.1 indolepyruvate oxidoreductase subunit beta [Tenuifilaceae bacterium]